MLNLNSTRNAYGESFLVEINRSTFANRSSAEVFGRAFGHSFQREDALYIIIGSDSGLLVDYLRSHEPPAKNRYLFIEPAEIAPCVADRFGTDDQFFLATAEEWLELDEQIHLQEFAFLERVEIVKSLAALDDYQNVYTEIAWQVKNDYQQYQWNTTASLTTDSFMRATLSNLPDLHLNVAELRGRFSGKTAIMLAGGPSLNRHLDWIKAHRDEIVLLSVSRIARTLLKHGLTPDFVFHVDPHKAAFNVSKEALKLPSSCTLICSSNANPLFISQWPNLAFYAGERYPWPHESNEESVRAPGPNVTNFATHIAVEMGFSTIVFAGLDLCFASTGIGHAADSNEAKAGPNLSTGTTWVETYAGKPAETTNAFATSIQHFARAAKAAAEQGVHFFNMSQEAANIEGIPFIEASEIQCTPAGTELEALRTTYRLRQFTASARQQNFDAVGNELERVHEALTEIEALSDKALKTNEKLFAVGKKSGQVSPLIRKIESIEHQLQNDFAGLYTFVLAYGVRYFLSKVSHLDEADWSDEDTRQYGENYYLGLRDSTRLILALVEKCQAKLTRRRQELSTGKNLHTLAQLWQEHEEPLRYLIWQQLHETTAQTDIIRILEEQRELLWQQGEQEDIERCSDYSSPEALRTKLLQLFTHTQTDALRGLHTYLHSADNQQYGEDFSLLAQGLLCELEGSPADAMEAYQGIMAIEGSSILEEALKRVLHISLSTHNQQNILAALQCLSLLSPTYLPFYAEFLSHNGQLVEALDALAEYQKVFPNDVHNLLRVVPVYLKLELYDGAREMLNLAEQLEPENPAIAPLRRKVTEQEHA